MEHITVIRGLFNPFRKLTPQMLNSWSKEELIYAVAQHFKRAFSFYSLRNKTGLLVTAYQNEFEAKKHLERLTDSRHSALIQLRYTSHYNRILEILKEQSDYLLFDGNTPNLSEILSKSLERFVPRLLSYLNQDTDMDLLTTVPNKTRIEVLYGELFVVIGEGFGKKIIPLMAIEK
jgi:hypothetical protein